MAKIIVNGDKAVLGRLCSFVAKELLKGNSVEVINCERILASGNKQDFAEKILRKRRMGRGSSMKGPTYIRQEDRLVKRMIRGMLPWDRPKGREAFKRLRCYIGKGTVTEEEVKKAKTLTHQIPSTNFTIKEVTALLR